MSECMNRDNSEFLSPRRCMREPIPEIFMAAELLNQAADAHLAGDVERAGELLTEADIPALRLWTDSLWGSRKNHPNQWTYHRYRLTEGAPVHLARNMRIPVRMPTAAEKAKLIKMHGRHCAFCQIPLVRPEVRKAFHKWYPEVVPWGGATHAQHAAFQGLWMQFDHLLPHSRGGDNSLENLAVTCAGCNFGRMHWTLDEVGILDPRGRVRTVSSWDGLERVLVDRSA